MAKSEHISYPLNIFSKFRYDISHLSSFLYICTLYLSQGIYGQKQVTQGKLLLCYNITLMPISVAHFINNVSSMAEIQWKIQFVLTQILTD